MRKLYLVILILIVLALFNGCAPKLKEVEDTSTTGITDLYKFYPSVSPTDNYTIYIDKKVILSVIDDEDYLKITVRGVLH